MSTRATPQTPRAVDSGVLGRPPYWTTPHGLYRCKITHPVTGERVTLSSHDLGDLMSRRARWQALRREYETSFKCRCCGAELVASLSAAGATDAAIEIARGNVGAPEKGRTTLAVAWRKYEDEAPREHRRKLRSVYRHQVEPFFPSTCTLLMLSERRIAEWFAALAREGYAPKTIRDAFFLLVACYRRAARARLVPKAVPWGEDVPVPPPRAQTVRRVLEPRELAALVMAMGGLGSQTGRLTLFAGLTGLRNGELAALSWDDIDLPRGTMIVRHQALDEWRKHYPGKTRPDFPTKDRKTHAQLFHPQALEVVSMQARALAALGWLKAHGPVWPSEETGTWRNNATALRAETMQAAAKRAGLDPKGISAHALRHTFVTLEIRGGADLLTAQGRVGHSSVRTTAQSYAHAPHLPPSRIARIELATDERSKAIAKL